MFIHCTNLWSVVSYHCDFFQIQVESGGSNLNWHLVLDPKILCGKKVDCTPQSSSKQVRVNTLPESPIHQRCVLSRTRVMHSPGTATSSAERDAPDISGKFRGEHTGRDWQARANTFAESPIHQRCVFSRACVMHCQSRNFKGKFEIISSTFFLGLKILMDSRMQTNHLAYGAAAPYICGSAEHPFHASEAELLWPCFLVDYIQFQRARLTGHVEQCGGCH